MIGEGEEGAVGERRGIRREKGRGKIPLSTERNTKLIHFVYIMLLLVHVSA